MSVTSYLAEYGPRLLSRGYPIVPILPNAKHPGFDGWQQTQADETKLNSWLGNGFAKGGVGVLTRTIPAVDIDVEDPDIVQKLVDWCETNIGPTVRRVGYAPKQLLVYRTEEPFPKISSNKYADFLNVKHKVEILGDGQQFVAFAKHPDTKKPYEWVSKNSLADIPISDLPLITVDQAKAFIAYFESLVPDDWHLVEPASTSRQVNLSIPEDERILIHAKPKARATTEQLRDALSYLDPDMRMHEWVRVGMALYHQYDGADDGFHLWDEWSAKGVKYEPNKMRARWRSFQADLRSTNPVTAATILQSAKQERRNVDTKKSLLEQFLDRYVLIEHGNLVCDLTKPPHCAVSRLDEFRNATANVRHAVPAPTKAEPDKEKLQSVHLAWLVDEDRKTAQGVRYDPSKPFFFQDENHGRLWWVNEFYMPEFTAAISGDTSIFYDHMDYLFPIKREREWFTDWIAFNLQHPYRRCKVTPLHVSVAHGTGRGWLVELIGKLLGQWNCTKTKMSTLCGEGNSGAFTDFLDKSLFCAVEEVREGGKRYAVSDKTRDLLTENYLEVNVKHGSKRTQPVFTNFFFMSNHPDALVLTGQDRRINVFSGPKGARDRHYYLRLYEWLETDGIAALHHELMARDLSDFDWQHSMSTPARTQMISNNQTETEALFHELLQDPPFPAMTFTQIVREMTKLSEKEAFETNIDEGQLTKLLQHHTRQADRIMVGGRGGKAVRPWVLHAEIKSDTHAIRQSIAECGL